MPKRIAQEVKTKAMELFLEGKPAKDIAEKVSDTFNTVVKPSTICYAFNYIFDLFLKPSFFFDRIHLSSPKMIWFCQSTLSSWKGSRIEISG